MSESMVERVAVAIENAIQVWAVGIPQGESREPDYRVMARAAIDAMRGGKRGPRSTTSWPSTILHILTEANRPMTYAELKSMVAQTHLAPKLARSDKSFYGALLKLDTAKLAVRHNGHISESKVYERFKRDVAAGVAKEGPAPTSGGERTSPAKSAVLKQLNAHPEGVQSKALIDSVIAELGLTEKNAKTAVYNLISRLIKRNVLLKQNDIVRLPHHGAQTTSSVMKVLGFGSRGRDETPKNFRKGTFSMSAAKARDAFLKHKKENPKAKPLEEMTPLQRRMQSGSI